jgi:hypothetical protein
LEVTALPHCTYTGIIQDKHRNILRAATQEVTDLISGSLVSTHDLAGMSMVERGTTMGNYIDDMN